MIFKKIVTPMLIIGLLTLTISGCSDKPVSCTDSKFKKLAQDAYLERTMEKLSDAVIEKVGQYNENDKNIALEKVKNNNTYLNKFEFKDVKELSRDEKINFAECEGTMTFDTYEGNFSYKIKYGIQKKGRMTALYEDEQSYPNNIER